MSEISRPEILTEYDLELVLSHHFHNRELAKETMKKAIRIYWPHRENNVAKSRIISAVTIIKTINKEGIYAS